MELLTCLICKNEYRHLGSHIVKAHALTTIEYKMKFGLNINHALITDEIKKKKQIAFELDREKYLENIIHNTKNRFKKGKVYRHYFSTEDIDRAIENVNKINLQIAKNCPFCNLQTKHYFSHIYNAHGFLYIKKDKGGDKL